MIGNPFFGPHIDISLFLGLGYSFLTQQSNKSIGSIKV